MYQDYEHALETSNLLDYDDLLLRCADLLRKHPQCVSNVSAVLVDEFQDTNRIQFELMSLFAVKNKCITVVGDPDQSIYGFRSAEIENLRRMQRLYKDTTVVLLEENYRSSGSILDCASVVIEQDTSRPAKKLRPTHGIGTIPVLRKLPDAAAEAQWLVMEIKRCIGLTGNLLKPSDFAILLRSASLSRQIESELGKQGVPYRMVGGSKFFDRVEIKLLLDYLRVISHPENSDALVRIINTPPRKIGEETIKMLNAGAEEANVPLWTYIKDVVQGRRSTKKALSRPAEMGLTTFFSLVEKGRQKLKECMDESAVLVLLQFIIEKLGFRDYLMATYHMDDDSRWANVEELLAQAADPSAMPFAFDRDETVPEIEGLEQNVGHPGEEALSRFLANVALSTEVTNEDGCQTQEKVTISTIHAAKGLEWPVVFVPAVYEGIIPHSRAEDVDEERRLLYVAMTRAQALLYLSFPQRDSKNGEETTPSSFLPKSITQAKFGSIGPKLHDEKSVFAIADILGRARPSHEDILEGMKGLPSVHDDRWTPKGEDSPDTVARWEEDDETRHPHYFPTSVKRRRLDDGSENAIGIRTGFVSSSTYTMNNPASFSISNNTMSMGGFSTARQHMAAKPASPTNSGAASVKENKRKAGLVQGRISCFFGQTDSNQGSVRPSSVTASMNKDGPSQPGAASTGPSGPPYLPRQQVFGNLGTRRIQPQRFQPPRPLLEISHPNNNYTWLSSESQQPPSTGKHGSIQTTEETSTTTIAAADGDHIKRREVPESGAATGVKPAATYHTTTMAMLQQRQSQTLSSNQTSRKTLGVRRSVHNTWAARWGGTGG